MLVYILFNHPISHAAYQLALVYHRLLRFAGGNYREFSSRFTFVSFHSDARDSLVYDAYVNVPFGLSNYKNRLFVSVPRRNPGIPATLNVVELKGKPPHTNPLLMGYPSYQMNSLSVSSAGYCDDEMSKSLFTAIDKNGSSQNRFCL